MTESEKMALRNDIGELPEAKLTRVVDIIKERNSTLDEHDQEVTIDMDALDVLRDFGMTELTSMFNKWEALQSLLDCSSESECYAKLLQTLCHVGHAGENVAGAVVENVLVRH